MQMIEVISENELTEEAFARSPVWSEHYDYEEIDELVSWGINKQWVLGEFQKKGSGSHHAFYSVPTEKLPLQRMRIFYKAEFTTPSGWKLSGYILHPGNVIFIFQNGLTFPFSFHEGLRKQNTDFCLRLIQLLKYDASSHVFPVKIHLPAAVSSKVEHANEFNPPMNLMM